MHKVRLRERANAVDQDTALWKLCKARLVDVCRFHRINGLTHINLTKLDCLDALDSIKLGVEYKLDGKTVSSLPADLSILEALEVVYEDIPGWNTDISKCRTWEQLPENAKRYIARIEELVGVKCKWIGVGPGRDAIVVQP